MLNINELLRKAYEGFQNYFYTQNNLIDEDLIGQVTDKELMEEAKSLKSYLKKCGYDKESDAGISIDVYLANLSECYGCLIVYDKSEEYPILLQHGFVQCKDSDENGCDVCYTVSIDGINGQKDDQYKLCYLNHKFVENPTCVNYKWLKDLHEGKLRVKHNSDSIIL